MKVKGKIISNVAHYPLHHVTYEPVKFEVAMSNSLGEESFTRKNTLFEFDLGVKVTQNVA